MQNDSVAILSIMSKFDEKSAREAAKRANKVYEEALSDIGNVNFDRKLIENFDKAMNLLKNKFKKVNLSSYTNDLLDSIFSDKDIAKKSKDIETFINKISALKKASSGQDINVFNTFSTKQLDAVISKTDKLIKKQDEIEKKTLNYKNEAEKIAKTSRNYDIISKNYNATDYSKVLESLKNSLDVQKNFNAEQNKSIENLAKMINLYQAIENSAPQNGTSDAIRYSKDLLSITQKIKEESDKIDLFSDKGATAFINNNGYSSINSINDYSVIRAKEDFVANNLTTLKAQEAKLQSELTSYISNSVQKNLEKVSKEATNIIDKAEKRVEKLQNEISKPVATDNKLNQEKTSYANSIITADFLNDGKLEINDIVELGQRIVSTIVELDTALVNLKKTTAMSSTQLEDFYFDANSIAKQMGVTTAEIIDQASAWSRLGYNSKEASTKMAQLSSQFASISPELDVNTAQEGLASIMKAWDIDVSDVKSEIMDNINALGNNMAESNQDIIEGMERSAAALASVGTSYEDAFAMFTGIQEVIQNPEVSGQALKSISMRIRGYDESTEEPSADLSNITKDLMDLTKTPEHPQGISIFKEGSATEFKSLVDYFRQINDIWSELSQKQQNDFLQTAFGKTQAKSGAALIQNFDAVTKALEVMDKAAGSSDREMEAVTSSLEFKINALQETWVGTVQNMVDRGDLGSFIDGLTKLSEAIGWVVDKAGLLGTIAIGTSLFAGANNVG